MVRNSAPYATGRIQSLQTHHACLLINLNFHIENFSYPWILGPLSLTVYPLARRAFCSGYPYKKIRVPPYGIQPALPLIIAVEKKKGKWTTKTTWTAVKKFIC